jgi:[acyl-carrier-protein] S-malonyltransferase
MLQLPENDITQVVEVGPGKVLTGLIKRTCRQIKLINISGKEDLNQLPQLQKSGVND